MGLAELLCIGIILTTGKVNSFPAAEKVVFIVIFLIDVFISIIFSLRVIPWDLSSSSDHFAMRSRVVAKKDQIIA